MQLVSAWVINSTVQTSEKEGYNIHTCGKCPLVLSSKQKCHCKHKLFVWIFLPPVLHHQDTILFTFIFQNLIIASSWQDRTTGWYVVTNMLSSGSTPSFTISSSSSSFSNPSTLSVPSSPSSKPFSSSSSTIPSSSASLFSPSVILSWDDDLLLSSPVFKH